MLNELVSWLLLAINAWGSSPVPASEREHVATVRQRVAESAAAVAYDVDEAPYYEGPNGRAITAINLVSMASLETRFEERIILGHCRTWAPLHECDSGKATGLLQVHLGNHGMRLIGGKEEQCARDAPDCLTKADLNGDETAQLRFGLHVLRTQGWKAWPKHLDARAQAAEWMRKHPPPLTDAQVMDGMI